MSTQEDAKPARQEGQSPDPRERRFDIDGLTVCAREWGSGLPVLALHGWLDNAASFDRLAPLLRGVHLLALDLPGHGRSDNKPAHATYNLWDDLFIILAVADAMGWSQFAVMGHSRGAMIATLLAAAVPERATALVCLDGLAPPPVRVEDTAKQLGQFLRDYRRSSQRESRTYESLQAAVEARRRAMPMSEEAARRIVERAVERVEGGYVWRGDSRLRAASALKLTEAHCTAVIEALACPALLVLAENGVGAHPQARERFLSHRRLQHRILPGGHHFHMEEQAADVAEAILAFLDDKVTGTDERSLRRGQP